MKNIKSICLQISDTLSNLPYDSGDLSDIGNEIGIILGKHFSEDIGFDMESFRSGLKHGVDLSLAAHGLPVLKKIDSRVSKVRMFGNIEGLLSGGSLIDSGDAEEVDPDERLIRYYEDSRSMWTEYDGQKVDFSERKEWHYILSDIEQNIFLLKRLLERGLIGKGAKMVDCGIGLGTALYDFYLQSESLGLDMKFYGIERHYPYIEFLKENLIDRWEGNLFLIEGGIEDQSYGEYDIIYSFTPFRELDRLRSFYQKVASEMKTGSLMIENKGEGLGMAGILSEISGLEKIEIDGIFVFKKA